MTAGAYKGATRQIAGGSSQEIGYKKRMYKYVKKRYKLKETGHNGSWCLQGKGTTRQIGCPADLLRRKKELIKGNIAA